MEPKWPASSWKRFYTNNFRWLTQCCLIHSIIVYLAVSMKNNLETIHHIMWGGRHSYSCRPAQNPVMLLLLFFSSTGPFGPTQLWIFMAYSLLGRHVAKGTDTHSWEDFIRLYSCCHNPLHLWSKEWICNTFICTVAQKVENSSTIGA